MSQLDRELVLGPPLRHSRPRAARSRPIQTTREAPHSAVTTSSDQISKGIARLLERALHRYVLQTDCSLTKLRSTKRSGDECRGSVDAPYSLEVVPACWGRASAGACPSSLLVPASGPSRLTRARRCLSNGLVLRFLRSHS